MATNRGESERALQIARRWHKRGFPRESLKFARKSLSLLPSDDAKALIAEVCRLNPELGDSDPVDSVSSSPFAHHAANGGTANGVHHRANFRGAANGNGAFSASPTSNGHYSGSPRGAAANSNGSSSLPNSRPGSGRPPRGSANANDRSSPASWLAKLATPSGLLETADAGLSRVERGATAFCARFAAPLLPPTVGVAPRFRRPLVVLVLVILVALAYRLFVGRPNLMWLVPGQMPGDIAYHSEDGRIGIYIPFMTFTVFSILGNYLTSLAVGGGGDGGDGGGGGGGGN